MPLVHPETFTEFQDFIFNNNFCVVDFYADWCGPCKKLGVEFEQYKNNDAVCIIKINVDNEEFNDFCKECKCKSIPHIIFFKNGDLQSETVTGCDIKKINDLISELNI